VPRRNELCTQIPLQSFSVILGNVIYFFFCHLEILTSMGSSYISDQVFADFCETALFIFKFSMLS